MELGNASSSATTSECDGQPKSARRRLLTMTSKRRRRLVAEAVVAGLVGHALEYLEHTSVQEKTSAKYEHALRKLTELLPPDVQLGGDAEVDEAVAHVLNQWFLEGLPPSEGEVTLAAMMWKYPIYGKYGSQKLPRCWRAMKGWRRRAPARSRRPHAFALWAGIAIEMIRRGYEVMAIYLVMCLTTHMRPSEPFSILRGDLVPPVPNVSKDWHVNLFPEERPERSKMYAANDSVCLTTQLAPWLEELPPPPQPGRQDGARVRILLPNVRGDLRQLSEEAGTTGDGTLREPAFRAGNRCCARVPEPFGDQEARSLEKREKCDPVRTKGAPRPVVPETAGVSAKLPGSVRKASGRRPARPRAGNRSVLGGEPVTFSGSEKGQYFADLFAGTDGVGRAASGHTEHGHTCTTS